MSSQSSDDEAPQEVSFAQAQTQALSQAQSQAPKKTSKKKKQRQQPLPQRLDAKTKAILEAGLDETEERELARREARFERTKAQTRRETLASARPATEKKLRSNLKVVCLKRVPVIAPSGFSAAKARVLHRSELSRKPLRLAK